jgi:hypothetical protein
MSFYLLFFKNVLRAKLGLRCACAKANNIINRRQSTKLNENSSKNAKASCFRPIHHCIVSIKHPNQYCSISLAISTQIILFKKSSNFQK